MSNTETAAENENSNANGFDDSVCVPLSEAAARLRIILPRLTRLVKRPEFTSGITKTERQTKTGTRTVTLVSISVLEAVRLMISEQKHEQNGAKRYRSGEALNNEQLPALAQMLLAERETRLADKDAEIRRLTETLTETQSALRLAQENLAREQALRSLPPPIQELSTRKLTTPNSQLGAMPEAPPEAVGSPETNESGQKAAMVASGAAQTSPKAAPGKGNEPDKSTWARVKQWFSNA